MQQLLADHRKQLIAFTLFAVLASVAVYFFTGNLFVLLTPVVLVYGFIFFTNWKLAYWLLILFIPLSIQFSLQDNSFALSLPDEPMCWLFFLSFILLYANNPKLLPAWWWRDPLVLVIALQLTWLVVAVMFSDVFFLSLKFLLAKVWYLVCFFVIPIVLVKEKKDFKTMFVLFLVPVMSTILVITARQISGHSGFGDIAQAVGRLYVNHVEYGAVISIFFPVLVAAYLFNRGTNRFLSRVLLLLVLFSLVAVFFTYARAALLGVVFALLVGIVIRYKRVNYIMPSIYAGIIFLLVFFINDNKYLELRPDYTHTYMHNDYAGHLSATLAGRDLSSMERLYRWIAAVRMSTESPLVGYGPHGFVHNYKQYTLPAFRTYTSINTEQSTTHNYFLFMLTEQGWPAMLLYAFLIVVFFARAQKTYHRFNDRFYKACTLALAMAFAAAFVNNFFSELIETHKVGAMFYLILSLMMILDQKSKEMVVRES